MDVREPYLADLRTREAGLEALPGWLRQLRQEATESFRQNGFPTPRLEDWKYTNVTPFLGAPFSPVLSYRRNGISPESIACLGLGSATMPRAVVIDGHFVAELSDLSHLPKGVAVRSLATALQQDGDRLAQQLGRYASASENGFLALNTAFLTDGVVVEIAAGCAVETPVHLLFLTTAHEPRTAVYPRSLIVAEAGAQASIVESHVSLGTGAYLSSAVTEVVAGDNAIVEHVRLTLTSADSLHVGSLAVSQERASQVTLNAFVLDGGTVRNDVLVRLNGEGAETTLNGLFAAGGRAHLDSHTTIDHVKPHCTSHELYKGILSDSAVGIFDGLIRVRPLAQKSIARQSSKNLLLSKDATINTKPQLEIHADDVKCNHGSTIGQLDEDSIFYLRSRGLDPDAAQRLLTYAFASEMVERVKAATVRERLVETLRNRMPRRV